MPVDACWPLLATLKPTQLCCGPGDRPLGARLIRAQTLALIGSLSLRAALTATGQVDAYLASLDHLQRYGCLPKLPSSKTASGQTVVDVFPTVRAHLGGWLVFACVVSSLPRAGAPAQLPPTWRPNVAPVKPCTCLGPPRPQTWRERRLNVQGAGGVTARVYLQPGKPETQVGLSSMCGISLLVRQAWSFGPVSLQGIQCPWPSPWPSHLACPVTTCLASVRPLQGHFYREPHSGKLAVVLGAGGLSLQAGVPPCSCS